MKQYDLIEILQYISPADCNYTEWVNVGMALKHEGYSMQVWQDWSATDAKRFHAGECEKKWLSFNGTSTPVAAGTIVQMAKDRGWQAYDHSDNRTLDWDSVIIDDDKHIIDSTWIESKELYIPDRWDPVGQLIQYLETLFSADENVGYVTKSYESDRAGGKFVPTAGSWDRTAGQLIEKLSKCNGDIGMVLGDYNPDVGAWIRFNPLDGKGIKNENVTDFRFALVESDSIDLEKQNAMIRELELPVAALVYSGGKSLHAIVRIEASDYKEYRSRVNFLYQICNKNGLKIDTQNKNPSRLSRMPGVLRGNEKQYLLDTNIGKGSWAEWLDWINSVNDDLPDFENLSSYENNLPELSDPLIDGVLRKGHKMLLAGPSKAGKSFALIELCIAIAAGTSWLGMKCAQGKVLYVNLELDKASCIHRFFDVRNTLGLSDADKMKNIEIWNLRGMSVPMDKLVHMLIRRAEKEKFTAVVIDPIYKVITGDENSADQMAHFCNQFDKICTKLGCAVIYCHHHSKGSQGDKRSMDRASGSGVFARDPDALLDLLELEITDDLRSQEENKAICRICLNALQDSGIDADKEISQDDACSSTALQRHAKRLLSASEYERLLVDIENAKKTVQSYTAWRLEGTIREFPKISPIGLWFKYPVHTVDNVGVLKDLSSDTNTIFNNLKKSGKRCKTDEERKEDRRKMLDSAFDVIADQNGWTTVEDLMRYMDRSKKSVERYLNEHGNYWIANGKVGRIEGRF